MVDIRSRLVFLSLLFTINYNINSLMACPPSGGYSPSHTNNKRQQTCHNALT